MDLKNEYRFNKAFREYVDKFCITYGVSVEEALEHQMVKKAARHYSDV